MPRPKKNVAKKAPVKRTRRPKLFVDGPKPAIGVTGHNYIDTAMRRDALQYAIGLPATNGEEMLATARKIYDFLAGNDLPPVPHWGSVWGLDSSSALEGFTNKSGTPADDPQPPFGPTVYSGETEEESKPKSRFDAHTL